MTATETGRKLLIFLGLVANPTLNIVRFSCSITRIFNKTLSRPIQDSNAWGASALRRFVC